jgi:hypothetical protein
MSHRLPRWRCACSSHRDYILECKKCGAKKPDSLCITDPPPVPARPSPEPTFLSELKPETTAPVPEENAWPHDPYTEYCNAHLYDYVPDFAERIKDDPAMMDYINRPRTQRGELEYELKGLTPLLSRLERDRPSQDYKPYSAEHRAYLDYLQLVKNTTKRIADLKDRLAHPLPDEIPEEAHELSEYQRIHRKIWAKD